jgi:hypothetical protein
VKGDTDSRAEGHWREGHEWRRGVHHATPGDRQHRLDCAELLSGHGQIVGIEDREIGVRVRRNPALDLLLPAEPGAANRVEAERLLAVM